MRNYTQFVESLDNPTQDKNPGNAYPNNGVANHYTPIENIVTNVRNLFATHLGIVASVAEDGVSIKLNSSKFVSKEAVAKALSERFTNNAWSQDMSLSNYIMLQGLCKQSLVNVGQYYIVYYSPADMPQSVDIPDTKCPCTEMLQYGIDEAEMFVLESDDDDEELEDTARKEMLALIDEKDKVKASKQLAELVSKHVDLPNEYYWAGVKDAEGAESIALRWKYIKRRPHNKSTEIKRTLINIYNSEDGIWVGDFDKDSMFNLPQETRKLIETILELLGAEQSKDECVWEFSNSKDKKKDNKEDKDKDKKSDDDSNKEDKLKKSDDADDADDDSEDDSSRGDSSDDLLDDK